MLYLFIFSKDIVIPSALPTTFPSRDVPVPNGTIGIFFSLHNFKIVEISSFDSGKITGVFGEQPPVMTTREELKIDKAREEWKKFLAQGWRRTKVVW